LYTTVAGTHMCRSVRAHFRVFTILFRVNSFVTCVRNSPFTAAELSPYKGLLLRLFNPLPLDPIRCIGEEVLVMSAAVRPSSAVIVVAGVFELARELHALEPADRGVVLEVVHHLKLAAASRSAAVETASPSVVLPLKVPLIG